MKTKLEIGKKCLIKIHTDSAWTERIYLGDLGNLFEYRYLFLGEDTGNDYLLGNKVSINTHCVFQAIEAMPIEHERTLTLKGNNMKTVKLNNGTILEIGKKYRLEHHLIGEYVEVKAIDDDVALVRDFMNVPLVVSVNKNWLPYTAPQEEVKWKTFLIEYDSEIKHQQLYRFKSIDDAIRYSGKNAKITEVEIDIKEK